MDQGVKNVVHHAEMVVSFILLFHVHQIFIQGMQAGREHFCNIQARFRR